MKRIVYLLVASFSISIIILACTKVGASEEENLDDVDHTDKTFPVVAMSKPTANQVYTNADSIIVQGRTTDDRVVYKGKVLITNDATNSIVEESYYESHYLTAIDFRVAYKPAVTVPTDFTVFVEFQDHGLNTVSASIKVKVNP
jgi:hypothetical protein